MHPSSLAPSRQQPRCFTQFTRCIDGYSLPERFTFPFYYQPHPLCVLAAQELQAHLEQQVQWQHNFGLTDDKERVIGKMFGVLVVQTQSGSIGYLSAFSGKLAQRNHLENFVPPVFDMLAQDSFFLAEQLKINQLNERIALLVSHPDMHEAQQTFAAQVSHSYQAITAFRQVMQASRNLRKIQRIEAQMNLSSGDYQQRQLHLNQQSIEQKLQLRQLKTHWDEKVAQAQQRLAFFNDEIIELKQHRKTLSSTLQQHLFEQYRFLNANQQSKNLADIFINTAADAPPAGAGECAAPKLLHYAYQQNLKPLAMAEFWWGTSPKGELRRHRNFYPACQGKCQPILTHMLQGLNVDANPLLINPAKNKTLEIIYQDEVMLIVNKPAELLSVPGKNIQDSVLTRIKSQFPQASGPLIVHRLDMSTSGLMVIALTKQAHKCLQKQFIDRSVEKRYVALIDGLLAKATGKITLPLCGDYYDRPRQRVCEVEGKPAQTSWQILAQDHVQKQTRVSLTPKTGRTHQLRVHCAHQQGLNMPIVGDDLYGTQAQRLHLHAQYLGLVHPVTKAVLHFTVEPEF